MDSVVGIQKTDNIAIEMCEEFALPYVVSTSFQSWLQLEIISSMCICVYMHLLTIELVLPPQKIKESAF